MSTLEKSGSEQKAVKKVGRQDCSGGNGDKNAQAEMETRMFSTKQRQGCLVRNNAKDVQSDLQSDWK
ncbi:MAG: hypothetical protein IKH88_15745 [Prevotella sp.]|nr:hypothetical protein [Prevotella sp.]